MSSQPSPISHILIFAALMGAGIASLILFVRALIYFDQRGKRKTKGGGRGVRPTRGVGRRKRGRGR